MGETRKPVDKNVYENQKRFAEEKAAIEYLEGSEDGRGNTLRDLYRDKVLANRNVTLTILVGEPGMGKTTNKKALISTSDYSIIYSSYNGDNFIEEDGILFNSPVNGSIDFKPGLVIENNNSLSGKKLEYDKLAYDDGFTSVLSINSDNAHNLKDRDPSFEERIEIGSNITAKGKAIHNHVVSIRRENTHSYPVGLGELPSLTTDGKNRGANTLYNLINDEETKRSTVVFCILSSPQVLKIAMEIRGLAQEIISKGKIDNLKETLNKNCPVIIPDNVTNEDLAKAFQQMALEDEIAEILKKRKDSLEGYINGKKGIPMPRISPDEEQKYLFFEGNRDDIDNSDDPFILHIKKQNDLSGGDKKETILAYIFYKRFMSELGYTSGTGTNKDNCFFIFNKHRKGKVPYNPVMD